MSERPKELQELIALWKRDSARMTPWFSERYAELVRYIESLESNQRP